MRYIISVLFLLCLIGQPVSAADSNPERLHDALRDGVIYLQLQKWDSAAKHWDQAALALSTRKDVSKSDIAFLRVLAANSYQQADDARAYRAWTDGITLFLEDGATWRQYRDNLASDISEVRYLISSSFGEQSVSIDIEKRIVIIAQTIDSYIDITSFEGPKPGLSKKVEEERVVSTVAKPFFPRFAAELEGERVEAGRSRAFVGEDEIETNEQKKSAIDRGVVPTVEEVGDIELRDVSVSADIDPDLMLVEPLALSDADPIVIARPTTAVTTVSLAALSVEEEDTEALFVSDPLAVRRPAVDMRRKLTDEELEIGRRAWRYFEANRQTNTGLINSVNGYPFTTMWDLGSSLAGIHSAYELGVIDERTFNSYLQLIFSTMLEMPLYDDALPNREYDTRSAMMVGLNAQQDSRGSGFSSIDIGRTLIWLKVIANNHPAHAASVARIVERWKLDRVTTDGEFYRELIIGNRVDRQQEGRLGYEQYTALSLREWDIYAARALDIQETEDVTVSGVHVKRDVRAPDFLNLEPFLLTMLEFAEMPEDFATVADNLVAAHLAYMDEAAKEIIFTEGSIDVEPWFLYNVITSRIGNWVCKNHRGKKAERCQDISTKGAFAVEALYESAQFDSIFDKAKENFDLRSGYYSGVYGDGTPNRALTVNTNAIILESLLFKSRGRASFISNEFDERERLSRSRLAN